MLTVSRTLLIAHAKQVACDVAAGLDQGTGSERSIGTGMPSFARALADRDPSPATRSLPEPDDTRRLAPRVRASAARRAMLMPMSGTIARACARPAPPRHMRLKLMWPISSIKISQMRSCTASRKLGIVTEHVARLLEQVEKDERAEDLACERQRPRHELGAQGDARDEATQGCGRIEGRRHFDPVEDRGAEKNTRVVRLFDEERELQVIVLLERATKHLRVGPIHAERFDGIHLHEREMRRSISVGVATFESKDAY